jgi:hypothetical protein
MPALQQQKHSSLEASRHIRIVRVEPGTDTAISVRGLRLPFLRLCLSDRLNPVQHCGVPLACIGAVVPVLATNANVRCAALRSPGIGTAPPNLHFSVIEAEHVFKEARIQHAPLRWIAGLPQPPRCVDLQLRPVN